MKNNARLKSVHPNMASAPVARLKVVRGPHKGVSYKLVSPKVIIGRGDNCDIQLIKDKKCSRQQAVVLFKNNGYCVKDLSSRTSLKVNNVSKIQSELQDGDLIKCGTSVLQFECKDIKPIPVQSHSQTPQITVPIPIRPAGASSVPVPVENAQVPVLSSPPGELLTIQKDPPAMPSSLSLQAAGNKKQFTSKKSQMPRILMGVIVVLFLFLLLSEDKKPTPQKDNLRTKENIEEEIKTLTELKEEEKEKKKQNMKISFKNAQAAYVKGIRDYRKGVYVRAIESFRVCKTLYPQHELCETYFQKAKIKKDQLVQAWMLDGRDARAKGRYEACLASFKNVMLAIRDKNHLTYKEAVENYDICKIKFEGRY